tara:strand:- start:1567 stop:1872 length:306 start_codon:yes stop_codon:yes gene_type:complete
MSITMSLRRKLIAWTMTCVGFLTIALGTKWIGGPDWLVFAFVIVAVYALVALLLLADCIAAAADRRAARKAALQRCLSGSPWMEKRVPHILSSRNVSHETF